jgi:hypothetical protein
MSAIAGQTLFNSGPHRFILRKVGSLWFPPFALDAFQTSVDVAGPIELHIVQSGRLIASTDADLVAQINAIKSAGEGQLTGALVDNAGQVWTNMTFLTFRPADAIDRGRVISLAYTADYIRLA